MRLTSTDRRVPHRIRHIKCDEEKPACWKCRSTGRKCDGYPEIPKRRAAVRANAAFDPAAQAREALVHAHKLLITTQISPAITGTSQELQSFEFFRIQTGLQLSVALGLEPTYRFILQTSHHDDAVKAAVIAVGSMGQRLRVNQLLTADNSQANAFQEFAQLHYCKAIGRLRVQMASDSERSLELAIISCFLFAILEFLQGNDTESLMHLRSGLNILHRENKFREAKDPFREEITRVFSILDMEATNWLGLKSFQSPVFFQLRGPGPEPPSLTQFNRFEDALMALNFQSNRLSHFRRWITAHDTTLHSIPPGAHVRRKQLLDEFEQWHVGVEVLLERLGNLDTEMKDRVTVMQMNYGVTFILLESCLDKPDARDLYDRYEINFRQILTLAKSVIRPENAGADSIAARIVAANNQGLRPENGREDSLADIVAANNQGIQPITLFSFYAGIIQPLYFLAIKCRNMRMCQEAVALLSGTPWREGAWDSFAMAKIAKRNIRQLKEEGYYDD